MRTKRPPCPKLGAERLGIDVVEHARHLLGQLVDIDDFGRIGVKRRALDVGGEQTAVAIENVGTVHRRGNVVEPAAALTGTGEAERHQPPADQEKGKRKGKAGETEAVAAAREIGSLGAGCGGIWSSRSLTRLWWIIGLRLRPASRFPPQARARRRALLPPPARWRRPPAAWPNPRASAPAPAPRRGPRPRAGCGRNRGRSRCRR